MSKPFRPLVQVFILILPAILVTSCAFFPKGPGEAPRTYLLNGTDLHETVSVPTGVPRGGVLLVNIPQARAGFDTTRMAYMLRAQEVSYYAVNQWADTPARMLLPVLVQALENTKAWQAVVQMPSPVSGDYRLNSEGLVLRQEFLQKPSLLRLTLRVQLIDLRRQGVIGTKEFTVMENAPSDDAYGGVMAANRAVGKLLGEIVRWVTHCRVDPSSGNC